MSHYLNYYIMFGLVFFAGALGYWIVTQKLKDPKKIYLEPTP